MVIVKNRQMLFSNREQYIGTSYDNNSTNLSFRLDRINEDGYDLAGLVFKIDIKYSDTDTEDTVNVDVDVNDDYVYLTWQITNNVLQHEGTHIIQVRGYEESGTFKWSTYKNVIYIEEALKDVPESAATLTAMEQYKVKIDAKIAKDAIAETARATAETARATAETARATAETARATAETARATAESTRASEFATLKSGYDTASKLARSYAVGGTGTRTGEDTDNAKYYKEQAQAISVGSLNYESEKIHFGDTDSTTSGGETSSIVASDTNGVSKVYTFKDSTARSDASSAQNTANTAVSNAATAQSEAESAQSTADTAIANAATAQSTANTAVINAATAQSTADTAIANAATAQSTADTAIANAATAQSTANTAVENASTAQTTANNAIPKANIASTNQNSSTNVPSSALLYSLNSKYTTLTKANSNKDLSLPSGLQIRTGTLSSLSIRTETSISFGTAFSNACVIVIIGSMHSQFGGTSNLSAYGWNKSGFKAYNNNSANATMSVAWVAIGY